MPLDLARLFSPDATALLQTPLQDWPSPRLCLLPSWTPVPRREEALPACVHQEDS